MSLPGHRVTYADYKRLPDDQRYEVIAGELLVTPAPNFRHQLILSQVWFRLMAFVQSHKLGHVVPAPADVILSEHDVLQPDLLYVSKARLGIINMTGGVPRRP